MQPEKLEFVMIRFIYTSILTVALLIFVGCSPKADSSGTSSIYVTINPLAELVEELTCGDFDIKVLVPEGASPETFEPTARQIAELNDALLTFKVGLIDFEHSLGDMLKNSSKCIDLSSGIEPLSGCCSHGHHNHSHGIDPHIWTSPRELRTIVENMHRAVKRIYPDSAKYDRAANALFERIDNLDRRCAEQLDKAGVRTLMIYHPAFTYYARDYGIEQIAIEHEGKEPTPRRLASLIERARKDNIEVIFHQPQYSPDKLRPIAEECSAEVVVIDPLANDIIAEIEHLTTIICSSDGE